MINFKELIRSKTFLVDGGFKVSAYLPDSLSELYHENTKMHPSDTRPWLVPQTPAGLAAMSLKTFFQRSANSGKRYDGCPAVRLEHPEQKTAPGSLWDALAKRRSQRNYSDIPISGADLGKILSYSYGITRRINLGGNQVGMRAAPSAGALYPLDVYPLVNNVNGFDKGLHHYNVEDHSLELLRAGDFLGEVYPLVQPDNNSWLAKAGAVLFVTATFKRNQLKYGDRGYRGVLLDAGHVSQNILLCCSALGYGACVIVACLDDQINDFLQVDGVEESILFSISIGSPE